jgi:hypothetical protein
VWSAARPDRFTPGKDPVPIVQEAGWAPGLIWTCAKNLAPTGIHLQGGEEKRNVVDLAWKWQIPPKKAVHISTSLLGIKLQNRRLNSHKNTSLFF